MFYGHNRFEINELGQVTYKFNSSWVWIKNKLTQFKPVLSDEVKIFKMSRIQNEISPNQFTLRLVGWNGMEWEWEWEWEWNGMIIP